MKRDRYQKGAIPSYVYALSTIKKITTYDIENPVSVLDRHTEI
jgi:hypothetical protein